MCAHKHTFTQNIFIYRNLDKYKKSRWKWINNDKYYQWMNQSVDIYCWLFFLWSLLPICFVFYLMGFNLYDFSCHLSSKGGRERIVSVCVWSCLCIFIYECLFLSQSQHHQWIIYIKSVNKVRFDVDFVPFLDLCNESKNKNFRSKNDDRINVERDHWILMW